MLHRILFDAANMAESANLGAFLRMGETGKLASYTTAVEAGNVSFVFVDADVTVGSDSIAEVAHGLKLGDVVRLTTTGTLPAGLALATDYYAIRVDADNFKLAASLADAEAGIAVDITAAAGGGNHTVTEQERVHAALDVNVVNAIAATISGTVPVTATDLDIRNLVFATDKVDVSGSEVSLDSATLAALENISAIVTATDLDIRDLAFATDKVDVTGSAVSITGSVVVTATDLDIRDLSHTQDSIKIGDGTDFLAIDASGNIGVTDAGGSLTVDAVNLDIRDLTAASDSVQAWAFDGTGNAIGSTTGALNVNIANANEINVELTHNTAIAASAETVTTSSAALVASPLANRENMFVYNNGNRIVYLGQSGVSTANGFPIFPGSLLEIKLGAAVAMHAVAESGSQNVRVLQAS